ncbi:MAG TPA: hypothetical protein VFW45_05155 [Candidatus Polarisedimenticolia bacterium]|nr:hypothetical protein [Candidatus Polarisedimenticolia bacterium]
MRRGLLAPLGILALVVLLAASPVAAQSSTSYKVQGSSFDNAGDPTNGVALGSAHFHLKLDSIGGDLAATAVSSASFHADEGFVDLYRPAGEVTGVRFTNPTILQWNAEPSAQWYEVYQSASLPGTFGTCYAGDLTTTSLADATTPAIGSRFYYLVTARNRLRQEGTKGFGSTGTERTNTLPCP